MHTDASLRTGGFLKSFLFARKFPVPDGFTVTAHTGCLGTKANSIEAIEAGIAAGAQIVEFDLRFLDDGTPILSHDEPESEYVLLRDAFACLAKYPDVRANVDVKDTSGVGCVPALAEQCGVLERIFFTGIEEEDVAAVREKCPAIPYYLNTDVRPFANAVALADKVRALGAVGVNVSKVSLSPRLTSVFRAKGLLTSVWTVNGRIEARRILAMHPDNVTSKRPDRIREMIL